MGWRGPRTFGAPRPATRRPASRPAAAIVHSTSSFGSRLKTTEITTTHPSAVRFTSGPRRPRLQGRGAVARVRPLGLEQREDEDDREGRGGAPGGPPGTSVNRGHRRSRAPSGRAFAVPHCPRQGGTGWHDPVRNPTEGHPPPPSPAPNSLKSCVGGLSERVWHPGCPSSAGDMRVRPQGEAPTSTGDNEEMAHCGTPDPKSGACSAWPSCWR